LILLAQSSISSSSSSDLESYDDEDEIEMRETEKRFEKSQIFKFSPIDESRGQDVGQ
jgi:hypothetical protein